MNRHLSTKIDNSNKYAKNLNVLEFGGSK